MYVITVQGEEIGCISHGAIDVLNDVVELDIWLAERRVAGHGYGSESLVVLCDWLQMNYGVNRFLARPSRRNVKALRAMRRAGFRETDLPAQEVAAKLSLPAGNYADELLLFRILPVPSVVFRPDPSETYVFIDSEFTDLTAPQLISVGAVATDSTAFYAELEGWDVGPGQSVRARHRDPAARRRCGAEGDGRRGAHRSGCRSARARCRPRSSAIRASIAGRCRSCSAASSCRPTCSGGACRSPTKRSTKPRSAST